MPCLTRLSFRTAAMMWLILLAAAALQPPPAQAQVSPEDLLPVDEAFALSAQAVSRDRIELRWQIADGYYLYRHRTAVEAEAGFGTGPLQLPAGAAYTDEFFGDVETYRDQLLAVLPGSATAGTDTVVLKVKYQGCADLGICYPPQTRTLRVTLPGGDATAAGFNPLAAPAPGRVGLPGLPGLGANAQPLPPERAFGFDAIALDGDRLLLRFTPAPGYYLYRDRTSLALEGLPGVRAGTLAWPAGVSHRDEHFGEVVVYFDPVEVPLPLLRQRTQGGQATLTITFQGCQNEGICYPPMTRRAVLDIPVGTLTPATAQSRGDAAAPTGPVADLGGTQPAVGADTLAPTAAMPADGATPLATDNAASGGRSADASADNALRTPPPQAAASGPRALATALLLALLGGVLLNLMPCVLPVLSLKVIALAQSGGSLAQARQHALWYALGVLSAFAAIGGLVLALRATGMALGWGFQLQQPWFVAAMAYLLFAVGLSLSGVFTLGGHASRGLQQAAARSGPLGDFLTGVLACVVASPCIAPLMGPALAYAFLAPPAAALPVFLALGLGLALPFLVIGFVPALARRLPRPGAWMETLKQVLAFPMYLAAVWLLWVLGRQRGVDAVALVLAGAAVLALGLWWYERSRWRGGRWGRALALGVMVLALLPVAGVGRLPPPGVQAVTDAAGSVPYSEQTLAALRAEGRPVFVNMTADWCVTCKANERNVLDGPVFGDALRRAGAVYLRGDWTHANPEIEAFLRQHRAVGVPLYVVYPRGGGEGEVLPPLLTDGIVSAALARAAP